MGRLAEAVQANVRVVELAPNDLAAHRNLAVLFQAMGQMPQALAHAQRALEMAPPKSVRRSKAHRPMASVAAYMAIVANADAIKCP